VIFLAVLRRRPDYEPNPAEHPWSLPLVRNIAELEFSAAVTFLVGENGSGKSTLLEGIAAGMDAVAAGSRDIKRDPSLAPARAFARGFTFVRRRHARTRLFLRAEDVFGFTNRIATEMVELETEASELAATLPEGYGRMIATGAVRGQRRALENSYGANPDGQSHGETFLALLHRRLAPNGLYFLDEPETPLSPTRVLALMAMIAERVEQGCQFLIATHSPILLALPGAQILSAHEGRLEPIAWEDTDHVRVTRSFLNNPEGTIRNLMRRDDCKFDTAPGTDS
jgi:predicted ATPase